MIFYDTFITDKFPTNEGNFYDVLNTYLTTAGSRFKRDLIFTDSSKTSLEVCLIFLFSQNMIDTEDKTTALANVKKSWLTKIHLEYSILNTNFNKKKWTIIMYLGFILSQDTIIQTNCGKVKLMLFYRRHGLHIITEAWMVLGRRYQPWIGCRSWHWPLDLVETVALRTLSSTWPIQLTR